MKKRIIIVFISLLIILFLFRIMLLIIKSAGGGQQQSQRLPVAVEVDSVRIGPIQEVRKFTGSVYPYYQYVVAPKVSGRILEIRKRIGDAVELGEVVARIDDAEYQQAVLEAGANLRIAQAALSEAQSQFSLTSQERERVQSLQKKGIASPSELDAAVTNHDAQQSRLKLTQAQVEQREAALKSAQIRLSYTVLAATEPGLVGERFVDEGSLLTANAPVITIIGIDNVIIRTAIIERDYGRIHIGQRTDVSVDAFPSNIFHGKVTRIAPMLQQSSRMAEMEIEVVNDSIILKPGMFAHVQVVLNEKEAAQIVSSRAVVSREGQKGVFTVDRGNNTATYTPVNVGIVASEYTEILSPPLNGLVVTLGQHLLADGSPVILPESVDTEKTEKRQDLPQ